MQIDGAVVQTTLAKGAAMRLRRSLSLMVLVAASLALAVPVPVANAQESKPQAEGVKLEFHKNGLESVSTKKLEVFLAHFEPGGYIQGNYPEPMLIQVEEGPFWVQVQPGGKGVVYVVPPDGSPQRVKPVDVSTTQFPDGYVSVESGSAIILTGHADCFL
jgi:hypothetical protein